MNPKVLLSLVSAFVIPFFVSLTPVHAQLAARLGTSQEVNGPFKPGVINTWYSSEHVRFVYTAAELNKAGVSGQATISAIGWYIVEQPWAPLPGYSIKLALTAKATVDPADAGKLRQVVFRESYMPRAGGFDMLQFDEPFVWDGKQNILVGVCFDRIPIAQAGGQTRVFAVNPPNSFEYAWSDGANSCDLPTQYSAAYQNLRPQAQLFFESEGALGSFPDDKGDASVLQARTKYYGNSAAKPKPSLTIPQLAGIPLTITYKIVGPLPSQKAIYEATQNGEPEIVITPEKTGIAKVEFTESKRGLRGAKINPNDGGLDLSNVRSGMYRVEASFGNEGGATTHWNKVFVVVHNGNDLGVQIVKSPISNTMKPAVTYPVNAPIPVAATFINFSKNVVQTMEVSAKISSGGANLYEQKQTISDVNLEPGHAYSHFFPDFTDAKTAGDYEVEICVTLKKATVRGNVMSVRDQNKRNNCIGTKRKPYVFTVK